MMKKLVSGFLIAALLLTLCIPALADGGQNNFYIIEDSDTRYLTYDELWDWQYEAVGYIYNEIFARHGRPFRTGEKYDVFFREQAWYSVNPNYRFGLLNPIEVANEQLAHEVLKEMRAKKTTNANGKRLPRTNEEANNGAILRFRGITLKEGQRLPVYTAPSTGSYRSANGKALVSTNGTVKAAGYDRGWLLVEYETNGGSYRVGYVSSFKGKADLPNLAFYNEPGAITQVCSITDDPRGGRETLDTLSAGTAVTILCPFENGWTYVEVTTARGLMRGFVPDTCVGGQYGGEDSTDWAAEDWED